MLSIKAIYDGKTLRLLEKVDITEPREVIVTFLEEELSKRELYKLAENSSSFDFLKEPEEDIYTDRNLKLKY